MSRHAKSRPAKRLGMAAVLCRAMARAAMVALGAGGCAPAPAPAVSDVVTPSEVAPVEMELVTPEPATARREAVLHFEQLGGRPFPYPLVRARVRGVETWLIVDTGASHTVLDVWLVEQLGVELSVSEQAGEGHAGERVDTMVAHAPHVEVTGWGPIPGDAALAVRLPAVFRDLGLGGVLSPQSLATPRMAVRVDLPGSRLGATSMDRARREGDGSSLGPARPCVVGGEPAGVVYLVDALVQGQPARLVVDSGAARSDLLSESEAGRRLKPQAVRAEASYTVSGRVSGTRVDRASLVVGNVARTLDLGIMAGAPAGACPRDGHLGLDVLRDCVLLLAPGLFGARCRVP